MSHSGHSCEDYTDCPHCRLATPSLTTFRGHADKSSLEAESLHQNQFVLWWPMSKSGCGNPPESFQWCRSSMAHDCRNSQHTTNMCKSQWPTSTSNYHNIFICIDISVNRCTRFSKPARDHQREFFRGRPLMRLVNCYWCQSKPRKNEHLIQ